MVPLFFLRLPNPAIPANTSRYTSIPIPIMILIV